MKTLKKDLQAVIKELKALAKKMEKTMKAVDSFEKAQAAAQRKFQAQAKPTTKAVTKKVPAVTATDQVVNIIKRSKKGVDAPTLMKKTGFEDKKVRNILMRASKLGKIKRVGRGVYVGA